MIFKNREEAGKVLAEKLSNLPALEDAVVLGLPRGGVPVAFEVAQRLKLPLDVFVVRKLGFPDQPELAMGAIASGGAVVLNRPFIDRAGVPESEVQAIIKRESAELERREKAYSTGDIARTAWNTVILVDDGLATGSTMGAAVGALIKRGCQHITIAVPVSSREAIAAFERKVDNIIYVQAPQNFMSVGQWFEDFTQTTDAQVRKLLEQARASVSVREAGVNSLS